MKMKLVVHIISMANYLLLTKLLQRLLILLHSTLLTFTMTMCCTIPLTQPTLPLSVLLHSLSSLEKWTHTSGLWTHLKKLVICSLPHLFQLSPLNYSSPNFKATIPIWLELLLMPKMQLRANYYSQAVMKLFASSEIQQTLLKQRISSSFSKTRLATWLSNTASHVCSSL